MVSKFFLMFMYMLRFSYIDLRAKLRYSTLGTPFKIKTPVHLLNSNTAVFFPFISFPSFIFPLFQTKPSHEKTPKPLKLFSSLSLSNPFSLA